MHVLVLKEPRDEESGPDPYVKVDTFLLDPLCCTTVFRREHAAVVSAAVHRLLSNALVKVNLLF